MSKATIIFETDTLVKDNETLASFVSSSKKPFEIQLIDGELYVIVKEIKEEKQTIDEVRMLAGNIARELSGRKIETAVINEEDVAEAFNQELAKTVTALVEGWNLGAYKFITYLSKEEDFVTTLSLADEEGTKEAAELGRLRAEATAFTRDLMNEIPNVLNPDTFPQILAEEFEGTDVEVTIYNKEQLEEMEMNGILAVGRGSKHDPAFVELTYKGDDSKPLVALVGKGVTFDTGGISLKGGRDLSSMKMDMGGAAAVAGAMKLLASTKAAVNVVALIQIVENMPDSNSLLPGEVIQFKNGHNVQVGNTDAEGRLILADGLIRAGELEADYVFNIATLTGAIVAALGSKVGGIFGDEELMNEMKLVGDENGDRVWPMPLVDDYESYLASDYADFSNISTKGEAGSITAGLFLRKFVQDPSKWIHIDKAGRMIGKANGYYADGAPGFGARLLADFTVHVSK